MKYKEGQELRVVSKKGCVNGYDVSDVVKVLNVDSGDKTYDCIDEVSRLQQWVSQKDLRPIKNKIFVTLDGVDYSESTLRSLIKKATS